MAFAMEITGNDCAMPLFCTRFLKQITARSLIPVSKLYQMLKSVSNQADCDDLNSLGVRLNLLLKAVEK
jgi:hypothetical protein